MSHNLKSLSLGVIMGIVVSTLVFGAGLLIWQRLICAELKLPADQIASIVLDGEKLDFVYHPSSHSVTQSSVQNGGYDFPANVGFGSSWNWGSFIVTQVSPDCVVLLFRPDIVTRISGPNYGQS